MFPITKLAASAVAGVLSLTVTGAAALAAFQPVAPAVPAAAVVAETPSAETSDERKKPGEALEAILDRLVQNGTITAAQKEAILKALKEATDRDHDGARFLKQIFEAFMRSSVAYLGLPAEQVTQQLREGKSLGQIADATAGKSREGLITHLLAEATAAIDKAVADGKVTQEQADRAKATLRENIVKFVDKVYEKRPDRPKVTPKDYLKFMGDLMKAAIEYFGVERGEIQRQLAQGKSLGEIADATPGKSKAGLIQAVTAAANANIDAAVANGKLTAEQGAEAKTKVAESVTRLVDAKKSKDAAGRKETSKVRKTG